MSLPAYPPPVSSQARGQVLRAVTIGCIAGVAMLALGSAYVFMDPIEFGTPDPTASPMDSPLGQSTPFLVAGIVTPKMHAADAVRLADDADVVCVLVKDQPRAYALKAMRGPGRHIVNDLIGGVPVSVTYCDLCDSVRVFTEEHLSSPLQLNQGGRLRGRMLLHMRGAFYFQDTQEGIAPNTVAFPFSECPFERMNWKKWRQAHPTTSVFIGVVPDGEDEI